jgi:hypothetical protein
MLRSLLENMIHAKGLRQKMFLLQGYCSLCKSLQDLGSAFRWISLKGSHFRGLQFDLGSG